MKKRELVLHFILGHFKKKMTMMILLAALAATISAPIPFLYKKVIDSLSASSFSEIFYISLIYLGLIVLNLLVTFTKQMIHNEFQFEAAFTISRDIYRTILKMPYSILAGREPGDIIKLFTYDSSNLYGLITFGMITIISVSLQLIIDLVIMYILFGPFVALVILVLPVYFALIRKGVKNVDKYGADYETKQETWFSDTYSPMYRFKEVKSRRVEHFLMKFVNSSCDKVRIAGAEYGRASTVLYGYYDFFDKGLYIVIFLAGVYAIIKGYITIGTLFAAFYVLSSVVSSLNNLCLAIVNDFQKRIPSLDRLVELYSVDIPNPKGIPVNQKAIQVDFHQVEFRHEESNFTLRIPQLTLSDNKKYVVVGKTGAGKSTFIDLLNGLRFPNMGEIKINGVNTADISEQWWKSNVFVLLQDSYIFRGSIEDNILMDDIESAENLPKLIEEKGFAAFFTRFKEGIKTSSNEGLSLSGGEKRIISILRMLLRSDYQMIMIDEGKSGLDAELRKNIDFQMESLLKGKLSITITHNLNEISKFDEVLFVNNGVVINGTHQHLSSTFPDYAEFIKYEDTYDTPIYNKNDQYIKTEL